MFFAVVGVYANGFKRERPMQRRQLSLWVCPIVNLDENERTWIDSMSSVDLTERFDSLHDVHAFDNFAEHDLRTNNSRIRYEMYVIVRVCRRAMM
jgi:hypothetical protein